MDEPHVQTAPDPGYNCLTAVAAVAVADDSVDPLVPAPAPENTDGLDESAFCNFAPLLAASQDYARFSGCRFRSSSFSDILTEAVAADTASNASAAGPTRVGAGRSQDSGPRLAAKLRAAPLVSDFGQRLRAAEPELVEELKRAFHIEMVESVRNAMMAMFNAMEMFPPSPPPPNVPEDDCAYEDVTAALPELAQRLYNDQVRRLSSPAGAILEQRARTAAFIVDFAHGVGVELPKTPETQQSMLKEFVERVSDATEKKDGVDRSHLREIFLKGLGAGAAAEALRADAKQWWGENWKTVLMGAAVASVFGLGAIAAVAAAAAVKNSKERNREDSPDQ